MTVLAWWLNSLHCYVMDIRTLTYTHTYVHTYIHTNTHTQLVLLIKKGSLRQPDARFVKVFITRTCYRNVVMGVAVKNTWLLKHCMRCFRYKCVVTFGFRDSGQWAACRNETCVLGWEMPSRCTNIQMNRWTKRLLLWLAVRLLVSSRLSGAEHAFVGAVHEQDKVSVLKRVLCSLMHMSIFWRE